MASQLSLKSTIKLHDGNNIPIVGFGTYEMDGKTAYNGVTWALEAGYRHIDSAEWYENERECGQAILDFCKKTNTPREEIFFTTKLHYNNGYENVKEAIYQSLKKSGLDYIDLYLIHGPIGGPKARKDAWRAICDVQKEDRNKLRSIGISNFGVRHMQELLDEKLAVPVINQMELHPFHSNSDIVAFCRKHNIILEAWAPLVRGLRFKNKTVAALATQYNKTPAHILLRYSIQKGYVVLPKSVSKDRIIANTQIYDFELTLEDMVALDALDEGLVTDWDPTNDP